ncbi:MAG TPA: TolC family protein [Cyclobacteriaceae bacterium]|nr:TolC family protein [Cyclobacteriaceae bacterium]
MKRTLVLVLILSWTGSTTNVFSQSYTLRQVLEQGSANYPLVKARAADAKGSDRDARAASLEYLPRISAQHQYTYGTSNSLTGAFYPNPAVISPSGGIRTETNNTATWGSYSSLLLEWNVFNFGKVSGTVKASKIFAESTEAAYANEVFQQQVKIADAYLLTLMMKKLSAIQQTNVERALRFHDAVKAGVLSGMRAGADSSLASAEYAKAKLLMLDAERNYRSQQLRLLELAGITEQATVVIDSLNFFSAVPSNIDNSAVNQQGHPLLSMYRKRADATQARSIAVRRSFMPSITLVGAAWARGSGVYTDDTYHTDFSSGTKYQVNNYLLGAALRWTITDFASVHQRYKGEQYRVVRDQELYNEQNLALQRQLKDSDMQFNFSMEQARMAPIQLNAARQAFMQADARYRSGLSDLPTMLQSMFALNRAEADFAIAYVNAWRSLLSIAAAKGDFSVFMNSIQ